MKTNKYKNTCGWLYDREEILLQLFVYYEYILKEAKNNNDYYNYLQLYIKLTKVIIVYIKE